MTYPITCDSLIAVCAFRYALGRMTYVPSHVGRWLIDNRDKLAEQDRALIAREIEQADRAGTLGMEFDRQDWLKVREAMR